MREGVPSTHEVGPDNQRNHDLRLRHTFKESARVAAGLLELITDAHCTVAFQHLYHLFGTRPE